MCLHWGKGASSHKKSTEVTTVSLHRVRAVRHDHPSSKGRGPCIQLFLILNIVEEISPAAGPRITILRFPLLRADLSLFLAEIADFFCHALLKVRPHCPVRRLTPRWAEGQESWNHTLRGFRCPCRKSSSYQGFQLPLKTPGGGEFTVPLDSVTLYLIFFPLKKLGFSLLD